MDVLTQRFSQLLSRRQANGSLRGLKLAADLIDFSSNDYLSFSQNKSLQQRIDLAYETYLKQCPQTAATGSRLLTGHNLLYQQLENELVDYYDAEAALVVNSGYDANLGLLLACCRKTDLIIADELAHASLCDAMRWTGAETQFFRHNDVENLEILLYNKINYDKKVKKIANENQAVNVEIQEVKNEAKTEIQEVKNEAKTEIQKTKNAVQETKTAIFVLVESVYSMDGDVCNLLEIITLCEKYGAFLLVDEAHATGVFGRGLLTELNLQNRVWARMHTFGKALAAHGAVILGSALLKQYLLNFARPFIYTTALAPHTLITISEAHRFLADNSVFLTQIRAKIALFQNIMLTLRPFMQLSNSAIQWFSCPSNDRANQLSLFLRDNGFDVRPILSPTVAAGTERLRICLHLHNTEADFLSLRNLLQHWLAQSKNAL